MVDNIVSLNSNPCKPPKNKINIFNFSSLVVLKKREYFFLRSINFS